ARERNGDSMRTTSTPGTHPSHCRRNCYAAATSSVTWTANHVCVIAGHRSGEGKRLAGGRAKIGDWHHGTHHDFLAVRIDRAPESSSGAGNRRKRYWPPGSG